MPNGWEKLGAALAGVSDADREDIRTRTINALAARDYNVERAKGAIMKQRELESLGETFRELGIDSAEAVANAERAGVNLNTLYGGLGKRQEMGFRQAAVDAPSLSAANIPLRGLANKPIETVKIAGQTVYNPYAESLGEALGPTTEIGQSTIRANNARAQASIINANKPRSSRGSGTVKLSEPDKRRRDFELKGIEKQIDSIRSLHANPPSESASPQQKAKYKEAMDRIDVLQQQWNETMDRYDGKAGTSGMGSQGGLPPLSAVVAPAAPTAAGALGTYPAESLDGYQSFDALLPPHARSQLTNEGEPVTFANGQTWALIRGQPTRIK